MPLTSDEIRGRRFSAGLRGYEKEEVDSFLEQVAADYELALEAIATSSDPFSSIGKEVSDVLRFASDSADKLNQQAQEEARKIRQQATEEAAEIREEAAEEAASTTEAAREAAARLKAEGEVRAREVEDETQTLRRRTSEEIMQMRRQSEEEAAATLESAGEKAVALVHEAERHARELRENSERKYHQRLDEATQRHAKLRAQERELNDRVIEVAKTLQRLLSQLRPGEPVLAELGRQPEQAENQVVDVRDDSSQSA
jgi:DivIVA domain-containing protein